MRVVWRTAILVVLVACCAAFADDMQRPMHTSLGPNMVVNGNFLDAPSMAGHHKDVTSSDVKGWHLGGHVYTLGDGLERRIVLGEAASIEQKINTFGGQWYVVTFDVAVAWAGAPQQTVIVSAGDNSVFFNKEAGNTDGVWKTCRMAFKALKSTTVLRFEHKANVYCGTQITGVEVASVTPEIGAGVKYETLYDLLRASYPLHDSESAGRSVTSDYTVRLLDGSTQSREKFLAEVAAMKEKISPWVDYKVRTVKEDKDSLVIVVQRTLGAVVVNKYGARNKTEIISDMQDTWVRNSSGDWRLKASEERKRVTKIDGVEQK